MRTGMGTDARSVAAGHEYRQQPIERLPDPRYSFAVTMRARIVYEPSFLVAICVLGLFLFPAAAGPYPAVHGPATTLQAVRSCTQVQASIESAPRTCFKPLVQEILASGEVPASDHGFTLLTLLPKTSILRC